MNVGSRQRGRVRGANIVDVDNSAEQIKNAILEQAKHGRYEPDNVYGNGEAGHKIGEILASCEKVKAQKQISY